VPRAGTGPPGNFCVGGSRSRAAPWPWLRFPLLPPAKVSGVGGTGVAGEGRRRPSAAPGGTCAPSLHCGEWPNLPLGFFVQAPRQRCSLPELRGQSISSRLLPQASGHSCGAGGVVGGWRHNSIAARMCMQQRHNPILQISTASLMALGSCAIVFSPAAVKCWCCWHQRLWRCTLRANVPCLVN
jgi:hypothetical protein